MVEIAIFAQHAVAAVHFVEGECHLVVGGIAHSGFLKALGIIDGDPPSSVGIRRSRGGDPEAEIPNLTLIPFFIQCVEGGYLGA